MESIAACGGKHLPPEVDERERERKKKDRIFREEKRTPPLLFKPRRLFGMPKTRGVGMLGLYAD